ncbi:MAG: hypothetical protein WAU01_14700 [Saprospiraceae bacterium]
MKKVILYLLACTISFGCQIHTKPDKVTPKLITVLDAYFKDVVMENDAQVKREQKIFKSFIDSLFENNATILDSFDLMQCTEVNEYAPNSFAVTMTCNISIVYSPYELHFDVIYIGYDALNLVEGNHYIFKNAEFVSHIGDAFKHFVKNYPYSKDIYISKQKYSNIINLGILLYRKKKM